MIADRIDDPPMHTVASLRARGWVIPDGFAAGDIFQHDRRVVCRLDICRMTLDGVSLFVMQQEGVDTDPLVDAARADDARRRHENLESIGVIAPRGWFA